MELLCSHTVQVHMCFAIWLASAAYAPMYGSWGGTGIVKNSLVGAAPGEGEVLVMGKLPEFVLVVHFAFAFLHWQWFVVRSKIAIGRKLRCCVGFPSHPRLASIGALSIPGPVFSVSGAKRRSFRLAIFIPLNGMAHLSTMPDASATTAECFAGWRCCLVILRWQKSRQANL
ncbi:uncharacterized protein TM35_000321610 [Trypanosoma theileri]|uniref:Uncharacterized protein n=1 Tax=Trypanosoma theileri TaxID=67003 RepID=A0A1X0NMA7_9TRYP|nr:uncharacterized protein TM35_000321610 [Trypanosoma theileri]ORC85846.1 hypothetical protein TM35_000321610 [Trypanosoma theileri]